MLSRVTAKNVGDVFFETHCRSWIWFDLKLQRRWVGSRVSSWKISVYSVNFRVHKLCVVWKDLMLNQGPLSLDHSPSTAWSGNSLMHTTIQWKYRAGFDFLNTRDHQELVKLGASGWSQTISFGPKSHFCHILAHFNHCGSCMKNIDVTTVIIIIFMKPCSVMKNSVLSLAWLLAH